eukprot:c23583_g1_i1 orf=825-2213(+)
MEEGRLRNILSHLSPCSPSQIGNSAASNVISKAECSGQREKSPVLAPDNTHWHPRQFIQQEKSHRPLSKSWSSSNIFESRQSDFVEETTVRGTVLHPITSSSEGAFSHKELLSHSSIPHSELLGQKCGGLLRSKTDFCEVVGDPLCMYMNDGASPLKTNVEGYRFNNTGLTACERGSLSTHFHNACSPSDAEDPVLSVQCKSCDSSRVLGDGIRTGQRAEQVDHTLYIADDRKVSRDQTQRLNASQGRDEGNHHKEIGSEHQTSTKASDISLSSEEQNLLTCRDMHALDSQSIEAGMEVSGSMTLSRNNLMTGQRRRIAEDCIFCRIVEGQSPAFKLYEDEMCFCILDVHPLSHGHSLLIPKAHFPSLELTPPEVAAAMCATVPFISMAIMQATNCDSFNLLVNSGKAAGQVVFHTHFHIIPRRSGDDLWRSEDGSRRALSVGHETALLVQQIRHNLSNKRL